MHMQGLGDMLKSASASTTLLAALDNPRLARNFSPPVPGLAAQSQVRGCMGFRF
jgi:hypothetical protein